MPWKSYTDIFTYLEYFVGSAAGLSLMLNIETYEYAPGPQSDDIGVKVIIIFGLKPYELLHIIGKSQYRLFSLNHVLNLVA